MFARDDDEGWKQSNAFKKAFSIDVDIDFIGVWCVHPEANGAALILILCFPMQGYRLLRRRHPTHPPIHVLQHRDPRLPACSLSGRAPRALPAEPLPAPDQAPGIARHEAGRHAQEGH